MSLAMLPMHSDGITVNIAQLLQYQKQAIRWLPPAISIWSQLSGQHHSRKLGRGMDFSEVRPYQAGDDVRTIDWRVTARTGKTHTKLFTQEKEQPVMLLVDISHSMKFGSKLLLKSVQACHFASLLSWLAISQKDRIGALIYNGVNLYECKPTARQQGALRIIDALIKAHHEMLNTPEQIASLQQPLRHMQRLCPKGSEITLISDFYALSEPDKQYLSQLRHHNRMQFVSIVDPLEQGETDFRGQELVADFNQSAWLNFSSKQTRDSLAKQYQTHQDFVQELARTLAIPLHSVSAAKPLLHQLDKVASNQTF